MYRLLLLLLPGVLSAQTLDSLRSRIAARIAETRADQVGVYFRDLSRGDSLLLDAGLRFHAASTMKVAIMIQLFRDVDSGRLSLDDSLRVHADFPSLVDGSTFLVDKGDDSDSTLYQSIGKRVSVRRLLELMETVSSNLATDVLVERVDAKRANATAHALGADSIVVLRGVEDGKAYRAGLNNTVTARDLGVLLAAIAQYRAASPASCDSMLAILARQHFTEGIPAGLPPGTRVEHKTGWIDSVVYHDAGVVEAAPGHRYVLVVLTKGIAKNQDAYDLVADISRMVWKVAGK